MRSVFPLTSAGGRLRCGTQGAGAAPVPAPCAVHLSGRDAARRRFARRQAARERNVVTVRDAAQRHATAAEQPEASSEMRDPKIPGSEVPDTNEAGTEGKGAPPSVRPRPGHPCPTSRPTDAPRAQEPRRATRKGRPRDRCGSEDTRGVLAPVSCQGSVRLLTADRSRPVGLRRSADGLPHRPALR